MISSIELRDRLADLLLRRILLDDFEDWLVQQSWDVHQQADPDLEQLLGAIELRFAEYSSGHLSEEALREDLRPLVSDYSVSISLGPSPQGPHIQTGTSSVISLDQVLQIRPADIERVVAFA